MSAGLKVGFLGAGKMANALARGFLRAGLVEASGLVASDVVAVARETFAKETGGLAVGDGAEVLRRSDIVVVAVKPDQVADALGAVRAEGRASQLLLSIAAGVKLSQLEAWAWPGARVIRVMPNTPALVGASASAYALGSQAGAEDAKIADRLFGSVGIALEVKEKLLDAVTGLSGSGPAYGFLMIEALSDGGVAAGLPREVATRLAAQTLMGAARMVLETGMHPGALKDAVCSPGGTTIEAVHELEKAGVRGALMTAVRAAAEKSARLGK